MIQFDWAQLRAKEVAEYYEAKGLPREELDDEPYTNEIDEETIQFRKNEPPSWMYAIDCPPSPPSRSVTPPPVIRPAIQWESPSGIMDGLEFQPPAKQIPCELHIPDGNERAWAPGIIE